MDDKHHWGVGPGYPMFTFSTRRNAESAVHLANWGKPKDLHRFGGFRPFEVIELSEEE